MKGKQHIFQICSKVSLNLPSVHISPRNFLINNRRFQKEQAGRKVPDRRESGLYSRGFFLEISLEGRYSAGSEREMADPVRKRCGAVFHGSTGPAPPASGRRVCSGTGKGKERGKGPCPDKLDHVEQGHFIKAQCMI